MRSDSEPDQGGKGTWQFTSERSLARVRSNMANEGKSRCPSNSIEITTFPHAPVSRFTGPYMCYSARELMRIEGGRQLPTAMDMVNEFLKPTEC